MEKLRNRFDYYDLKILDSIDDLIRVIDLDNNVIYSNNKKPEETLCNNFFSNDGKRESESLKDMFKGFPDSKIIQKEQKIKDRYYSVKSSPIISNNEVIATVEVFRDITEQKKLEKDLSEKGREMQSDLLLAKRIQTKILPQRGNYGDVEVNYIYSPSEYLSGDIFDVFKIDEDNMGIYIGDVAGHGIASSLMTVFIRQTMDAIYRMSLRPSDILSILQAKFKELKLEAERYFTIFYGIYNRKKMEFKYANAGHNCIPFLYNENSIYMLENYGFPIFGFLDDVKFEEKKVSLNHKDKILLYTDGLSEAKNEKGEIYSEDRIKKLILENKGDILKEISNDFYEFTGLEKKDDIAILLMEIV